MTKLGRAVRMRGLIACVLAVLGLAAVLRWTAAGLDAVSARNRSGRKPPGLVVLNGVGYRPTREVLPTDHPLRQTYRANVEATDPVSGERLWTVTVREGTFPESGQGMLALARGDHGRFLSLFSLKLAAEEGGVTATTPDGGVYLVDPGTRQVRRLREPSPPPKPPVLDARLPGRARCEVHDRPLLEDVVPIRFGFGAVGDGAPEARESRFPNARSFAFGGCVPGPSVEARVLYCPDCRQSERDWVAKSAADRAAEGGGQNGRGRDEG